MHSVITCTSLSASRREDKDDLMTVVLNYPDIALYNRLVQYDVYTEIRSDGTNAIQA